MQVFSPVYAYGRSYEIYEKIGNILEHASHFPLAPFESDSIALSIGMAQVPEKIVEKVSEKVLEEQFNIWSKEKFPSLKGVLFKIVKVKESSDRIDLLLLMGGSSIGGIASTLKDGYERFKAYVDNLSLWDEYSLTKEELKRMESSLDTYDKGMAHFLKRGD